MVEARVRFLNQLKRYYYVTPTSYLELINLYGAMLHEQKNKINTAKERIANGLKVSMGQLMEWKMLGLGWAHVLVLTHSFTSSEGR